MIRVVLGSLAMLTAFAIRPERTSAQQPYSTRTPADWRKQLADNEYAVIRRRAAYVLGRLVVERGEAATALAAALKDRDLVVRWYAADSLGRIGKEASSALPKMIAGLTDPTNDKDVRRNLAKSLGSIAASSPEAVEELTKASEGDDLLYAIAAAEALVKMGTVDAPYKRLLELAADEDPIAAFAAIRALEDLQATRTPPPEPLAKLLSHPSTDVQRAAARLLGRQGWPAATYVLESLESGAPPGPCLAALVYAGTSDEADARPLQLRAATAAWRLLNDKRPGAARSASALLSRLGPVAIESMLAVWTDQDQAWRDATLQTLEKWMRRNESTLKSQTPWESQRAPLSQHLLKLLGEDDKATRRMTLWMLAELPLRLDPSDLEPHLETIRQSLRDADVFNRRNAASILKQRQTKPDPAAGNND